MPPRDPQEKKILLSRLLTHSGDQAWDFAIPLALVTLFPRSLASVAIYYFFVRLTHVLLITRVCSVMDTLNRLKAIRYGIGFQTVGIILATGLIFFLESSILEHDRLVGTPTILQDIGIVFAGVMASLGSAMTQIAIAQDWVPAIVPRERLSAVNGKLRQVDLLSELGAPVVAGMLMAMDSSSHTMVGFYLIGAWNVVSFLPEYFLLRSVYRKRNELATKDVTAGSMFRVSLIANLKNGWQEFSAQPAALAMISYAILWLTILSPHGVLLTAWLKSEWQIPEVQIGIFRGFGAVFGLFATLIFPMILRRMGLVPTTRLFILFEGVCLVFVGIAFGLGRDYALLFFGAILMSRIGLYGFSLGEMEIRQTTIPPAVRGKVNGFMSALTSLATLTVYGASSWLKGPDDFAVLVYASIVAVGIATLLFYRWSHLWYRMALAMKTEGAKNEPNQG